MILRRVMSGDHVTSHLLRDFIISSSGRVIVAIGFLLALSALEVGDDVDVGGGIKGRVTHVTIFSTYIRTDDGLVKIVPNDNIWKHVIVNQTTGVVKAPASVDANPPEAKSEAA